MSAPLPKPDLSLRVGVVGNRNFDWLDESDAKALEAFEKTALEACERVYAAIDETVTAVWENSKEPTRFSDHLPRIKVISALAKGGDQLGTLAAMEPADSSTRHCQFEFHGLLPFPEGDYPGPREENDNFSRRDLERYDHLIGQATSIVRLDGMYAKAKREEGQPGESPEVAAERERKYQAAEAINRPRRYRAYRAQALMLLQHSDVLVAIWDRTAVGKSGGSEETVMEALRVGIPVIHIQPGRDSAQIRFLFRRKDAERVSFGGDWKEAVEKSVVKQLAFPSDVSGIISKLAREEGKKSEAEKNTARSSHGSGSHEGESGYDPEEAVAEYFEGVGIFTSKARPSTTRDWERFEGYFKRRAKRLNEVKSKEPGKDSSDSGKPGPKSKKPLIDPYEVYRSRASELSGRYTGLYRGAFFLSYYLAAVAVLLAILGFTAFHYYYHFECEILKHPEEAKSLKLGQEIAFWLGLGFGGAKLFVLGWILRNQFVAKKECWQEKGGDFRFLSEMLRPMNYLAPLGMCTPNSRPAAHYADHDPRASWSNWLFRAIVRSQDMVMPQKNAKNDYTFSEEDVAEAKLRVLEHWLPGQITYHKSNSAKHHGLFHTVEKVNKRALWVVIIAVFAHVGLELAHFVSKVWGDDPSHPFHPPHVLMIFLLILATFLPAFIAISTGLLYQVDARRQSERSKIMASQLETNALIALSNLQDHPDGCNSLHVGGEIRDEIARIMIDEAADWQLLYRMDEVKAG